MDPLTMGAIAGGIGAIGKGILGFFQNKKANKIHPVWEQYQNSPYELQKLALAQSLFNGRMAGAGAQQQNIFNNQAATLSNINRNSGSAARALALSAASQGMTNDAISNLGQQEAQNKYNLLGNLDNAYTSMTQEGDKVYNSKLQKYQMDKQEQAALRNASFQNMFSGINDLGGLFTSIGQGQQQNDMWKKLLASMGKN